MTETERLESLLGKLRFPKHVKRTLVEVGTDATGDAAVWIWVILADAAPETAWSAEATATIRDRIREALRASGVAAWPYIRFRSEAEQREIEAAGGQA